MRSSDTTDPLVAALVLLRPRISRLLVAAALGVGALGSALALSAVSAWLITRAWQMPPVLDLTVAVVAVRALAISRAVLRYCERLTAHPDIDASGISVRVHHGEVTLCGIAPDRRTKRLAGLIAEEATGVVDVYNELRVQAVT